MKTNKPIIALLFLVLAVAGCPSDQPTVKPPESVTNPVQLDLWVMSQCPFGTHAELLVGKVKNALGPLVDVNLKYIVSEGEDGAMRSLHGDKELELNKVQICMGELYPDDQLAAIVVWNAVPDKSLEEIAPAYSIDAAEVRDCVANGKADEILRKMMAEADDLGVTGSPTFFLDGAEFEGHRSSLGIAEAICEKRDDDPDFATICRNKPATLTYTDSNAVADGNCGAGDAGGAAAPSGAEGIGSFFESAVDPRPVRVTVIFEEGASDDLVKGVTRRLKKPLPNAKVTRVAFPGPEAAELIESHGIRWLPAFLFDEELEKTSVYRAAKMIFLDRGDKFIANPILFGADLNIARRKKENALDIYYEPFDSRTEQIAPVVAGMLADAKWRDKKASITMGPALPVDLETRTLSPEKGAEAVEESLRQIAAFEAFPGKYAAYLAARYQDIEGDWKEAAKKAGIDPGALDAEAKKPERMEALLANSFAFMDMEVMANMAFVRDNQRLEFVSGRESFQKLLDELP